MDSITDGQNRIIVDFRENGLSSRPGLTGGLLQFSVESYVPETPSDKAGSTCFNLLAKVYVEDQYLGRAYPEQPKRFTTTDYVQNACFFFELTVLPQQIEAVEKVRLGNGLNFRLDLSCEILDSHNATHNNANLTYRISQSEWLNVLSRIGCGDYLLFELPVYSGGDNEIRKAFGEFSIAKDHFYLGHYFDVVAHCRIALEFISNDSELRKVKCDARSGSRNMLKSERLLHFHAVLIDLTHLAHHGASDGYITSFSRDEAQLVLGATASILSSEGNKALYSLFPEE